MDTPRLLVTNNGTHTATDWALVTAEQITTLDPSISEERRLNAMRLRLDFADMLAKYHAENQVTTRKCLNALGHHYDAAEQAFQQALQLTKNSVFAEHYAKPPVQIAIKEIIYKDFCHAQDVEKDWHKKQGTK